MYQNGYDKIDFNIVDSAQIIYSLGENYLSLFNNTEPDYINNCSDIPTDDEHFLGVISPEQIYSFKYSYESLIHAICFNFNNDYYVRKSHDIYSLLKIMNKYGDPRDKNICLDYKIKLRSFDIQYIKKHDKIDRYVYPFFTFQDNMHIIRMKYYDNLKNTLIKFNISITINNQNFSFNFIREHILMNPLEEYYKYYFIKDYLCRYYMKNNHELDMCELSHNIDPRKITIDKLVGEEKNEQENE